jgi:hypothetical protein
LTSALAFKSLIINSGSRCKLFSERNIRAMWSGDFPVGGQPYNCQGKVPDELLPVLVLSVFLGKTAETIV